MIFFLAFDFFDLFSDSIIVSWSIYITDYTECNREVGTFHQSQLQLKRIILAVCVVDQDFLCRDAVLTKFHYLQPEAFLHQSEFLIFTK
mgnify:CR=1 FL=1